MATVMVQRKFDGVMTGQSTSLTPWMFDAVSQRNLMASVSVENRDWKTFSGLENVEGWFPLQWRVVIFRSGSGYQRIVVKF